LTTIYVTHDQEEALSLSDRIIVMQNGTIQQSGTPQELYNSPLNEFVARFIGNSNLVPCDEQGGSRREYYFFRPEDTRIRNCSTESSTTISFQLTLKSLEYVGPYYILEGVKREYSVRAHASEEDLNALNISDFSPENPPQLWFCIEQSKTKVIPK